MTQVCKGYLLDPEISFSSPELIFDSKGEPYACVLNQTDLKTNANKFYRMQAVKNKDDYYLFIRYGRIGEKGQTIERFCTDPEDAIFQFEDQFKSKTKNKWSDRNNFKIYSGKYFLTQCGEKVVDDIKSTDPVKDPKSDDKSKDSSKDPSTSLAIVPKPPITSYHPDIVRFLNLISDKEMLRNTMIKMDIDVTKMPLGKINISQLKKAKELLLDLQKNLKTLSEDDLLNSSSKYYTYVPYACGRSVPPIIDSAEKISSKLDHLEDLENISINVEVMKQSVESSDPLKDLYTSLKTEISPVAKDSVLYKHIETYIKNSHGKSHHFKLNLLTVLQIDRPEARKIYKERFETLGNKQLLIHGSRMCNWVSILKNGLLLDPSKIGAVITGKMFGYGIYWANSFSKSAQYCGHSRISRSEIVCFTLAEVALGNELRLRDSDSGLTWDNLRKKGDYHSTYGEGRNTPSTYESYDDISIPNGTLKESSDSRHRLIYDEKIVYHQEQFDLRYMVLAEMIY